MERFLSQGAKRMAGCKIALDVYPNFKTHREANITIEWRFFEGGAFRA